MNKNFTLKRLIFCSNVLERYRQGFTLIELMVAISIVAILATIGFSTFSQSQLRARDAKRKQDLRALATALELFYQKNQRFPKDGNATSTSICTYGGAGYCTSYQGDNWIPELTSTFINRLPRDPVLDTASPWWQVAGYSYRTCGPNYDAPQTYTITAMLENPNDPDTTGKKRTKFCTGQDMSSITGWSPNLYGISSN